MKRPQQAVYERFMTEPEKCRSSHLYDHYQRGLLGIMRPGTDQLAAGAAWRAGRDTAAHIEEQQP